MRLITQFFREAFDFFLQIYTNRNTLRTLSWRQFEKLYIRNFFGLLWAILDPLAFVVILYFVLGARFGGGNDEVPFIVYLLTGYIVFDFFSSTMGAVTTSIMDHAFLLKKVSFRVAILPIVTVVSNLIMHSIVLGICIIVLLFNGVYPDFFWIQTLYYLFAVMVLMVSAGWLTSSIYLFFPDIRNVVSIITRLMFFLTPIFWNINGLLPRDQFILKLNPLYYIINGYRDSLLYKTGFWDHPALMLYFWAVCLVFLIIGITVFKKLRPHFADVVA